MLRRNKEWKKVSMTEIFEVLLTKEKISSKEDKDSNALETLSAREIMPPTEQNGWYVLNDTASSNLKPLKTANNYANNYNQRSNDNAFKKSTWKHNSDCKVIKRVNRSKVSEIKTEENVSLNSLNQKCSSNINQSRKVPEWDKVFKEILGNKSELKANEHEEKVEVSILI